MLILVGLAVAHLILTSNYLQLFILSLGKFGLAGIVVAGVFFSSLFTTIPAMAVLASLGAVFDPLLVAALGALGAVAGDFILFSTEKKPVEDTERFVQKYKSVRKLERTRWFRAAKSFAPLLGGLVLASPLPDEIAVAIWDSVRLSPRRFFLLAYIFKFFGIFVIAAAGRVLLQV